MSIKEKYGLTDEGVRNVKLGAAWTAISNVAVFAGVGILFLAMGAFVDHAIGGAPLPDLQPLVAARLQTLLAYLSSSESFRTNIKASSTAVTPATSLPTIIGKIIAFSTPAVKPR